MPRNDLRSAPVIGVERARGRAALRLRVNGIGMFGSTGELWSREKRSLLVGEGAERGVQKRKSTTSSREKRRSSHAHGQNEYNLTLAIVWLQRGTDMM